MPTKLGRVWLPKFPTYFNELLIMSQTHIPAPIILHTQNIHIHDFLWHYSLSNIKSVSNRRQYVLGIDTMQWTCISWKQEINRWEHMSKTLTFVFGSSVIMCLIVSFFVKRVAVLGFSVHYYDRAPIQLMYYF